MQRWFYKSDEFELKNPIIPISSATAPVFGTEDALWKLKRISIPVDQTFFLHLVNHRKYPKNDEIIRIGKERLPEKILEK